MKAFIGFYAIGNASLPFCRASARSFDLISALGNCEVCAKELEACCSPADMYRRGLQREGVTERAGR